MSKSLRNNILGYTLSILVTNQFVPACIVTIKSNISTPAVISYDSKKHKLPKDFNTLEYLIYANSIVHSQSKDNDHCVEYSEKTFNAYQLLAKTNNRKDLLDKIRFVAGTTKDFQGSGKHMWLQYKDKDNNVKNFETTLFMPKASFTKIREIAINNNHFHQKIIKVDLKSIWGSYFKIPQKDLIFYPGGLAGLFYDEISKK